MKIRKILKIIFFPVILAITIKSINIFSFYVAGQFYNSFSNIDPNSTFLLLSVHHVVQAAIAMLIIGIYAKIRNLSFNDLGFKKSGFSPTIKYVLLFCATWAFIQFLSGFILIKYFDEPIVFGFPLTINNFLGRFGFQLLLSGTSEEILFRVMVIAILADSLRNELKPKSLFYLLLFVSTSIFMFDHINFSFAPLGVTHFNLLQQITLLIFGIFYGWLFLKYKNYWGIAIAHNLLNAIISLITLFLYFYFS